MKAAMILAVILWFTGFESSFAQTNPISDTRQMISQYSDLGDRLERAKEYCLNPERYDPELIKRMNYSLFFDQSFVARSFSEPATQTWRWISGMFNVPTQAGTQAEETLISLLQREKETYKLKKSQAVCLSACVARVMIQHDHLNLNSLFASSARALEEHRGLCTEVVEVTRTLASSLDVEMKEISVDPIHALFAERPLWRFINTLALPMSLTGFYHKFTQVRLEDGQDYYFDPLWHYHVGSGTCEFYPASLDSYLE